MIRSRLDCASVEYVHCPANTQSAKDSQQGEPEDAGLEKGPGSGEVEPMLGRIFPVTGKGSNTGVELDVKVGPIAGEAPGAKAGNGDEGGRESEMAVPLTGVLPSCDL